MNYKIISDGCCDLEKEIIEQYNLRIIPFYISFDEEASMPRSTRARANSQV